MYRPKHFDETDPQRIESLIQRYSFATLISHDGMTISASHLPVLHFPEFGNQGMLFTHLARANQQWREFEIEREVLIVFHGPHAYISPSMYATGPAVPTWNYAAVHVYGVPKIIKDAQRFEALLRELVAVYEAPRPRPWGAELTAAYLQSLLPGIVGIEICIDRLEAKFKLSQNRPEADRERVMAELQQSPVQTDQEVADLMRTITRPPTNDQCINQ